MRFFKVTESDSTTYSRSLVINEAFSLANQEKAIKLILKYLNKSIGPLYLLPGAEHVIKNDTRAKIDGLHYIDDKGRGLRFNWLAGKNASVHSIDFFDRRDLFSAVLTLTTNGDSVATFLPLVVQLFKKPDVNIRIEDYVTESEDADELYEYRTKGAVGKKTLAKAGGEKDISDETKDAEKALANMEYADPDTIFDDLADSIDMVTSRIANSLVITGLPGVGKSFEVKKAMKRANLIEIRPLAPPEGEELPDDYEMGEETAGDYVFIKGAVSPMGLYASLYKYNHKIIILDDADKVWKNPDSVNILKGALDSDPVRKISWISPATTKKDSQLPPAFEYEGNVIFISNLYVKNLDSAVISRSIVIDLTLLSKDIIKRIKSIMTVIDPKRLTMEAKTRALAFLENHVKDHPDMEVSIRALMNYARIAGSAARNPERLMAIQANVIG